MEGKVDSAYCCLGISTSESKEGIKRCGRVGIEQHVAERGLGCNAACVFNAAEMNSGGNRRAIGQSRIRDREGIKRICDWHTDALRTKGSTVRVLEWIRGKPGSRPGSIKK